MPHREMLLVSEQRPRKDRMPGLSLGAMRRQSLQASHRLPSQDRWRKYACGTNLHQ